VRDDRSILEYLYPRLRRFAAVVGARDADPDDLVQEAMVRALRRGPIADLDDPTAYLRRTILNLVLNERRSAARHRRAVGRLGAHASDPVVPSYPSDVDDLLRLAPDVRAVLFLAEVEGHSYARIGDLLAHGGGGQGAGCEGTAATPRRADAGRRLRTTWTSRASTTR
jgi:DNA-directed RNA polymerase specialized sigma24 family protein